MFQPERLATLNFVSDHPGKLRNVQEIESSNSNARTLALKRSSQHRLYMFSPVIGQDFHPLVNKKGQ